MIKALLVDDDVPMTKYLEKLMPWGELGIHIIGKANSGSQALKLFHEHLPELVITDIGMPQMDGLEMAVRMRGIEPGVRIIFLTCHADFQYAKRALELEADDYIIKDGMSAKQLSASLKKSIDKLKQYQHISDVLTYRQDLKKNKEIWKQQLFKRLSKPLTEKELLFEMNKIGLRWEGCQYMLALGMMSYATFPAAYKLTDASLLLYAITNIAEELPAGGLKVTALTDSEAYLLFMVSYEPNLIHNYEALFEAYLQKLQENVAEFLNIQITILHTSSQKGVETIPQQVKRLFQSADLGFYSDKTLRKLQLSERKFGSLEVSELSIYWQRIVGAVKEKVLSSVEEDLEEITKIVKRSESDPTEWKMSCSQWIRVIELEALQPSDEIFHIHLQKCSRWEDTKFMLFTKVKSLLKTKNILQLEPKLKKIEQWISEHLSEEISLVQISEYLYLNPTYFSRYFKQETGMNFTEYVHRYKMKIACKLLKEGELSIEMIAMRLGYLERTYFSKIFKKYIGISPRDYR